MDFQKASGLSKCSLAKLKRAALFFLESRGFLLATLPWMSCRFQFSSDCRRMYIYPRCCQRGPQLFRGDVWVCFYLIYYSSGASWWWSWLASTSRQSCGHVECPPFVNDLSYSGWMELESFGDGLIAFPRLMGCQYLLPDVLGYLLSSRHCWSVWVHLGTTVVWLVSSLF